MRLSREDSATHDLDNPLLEEGPFGFTIVPEIGAIGEVAERPPRPAASRPSMYGNGVLRRYRKPANIRVADHAVGSQA